MCQFPLRDTDGGNTVTDSGKYMIGGLVAIFLLAMFPPAGEAAPERRYGLTEREQDRPVFRPERRVPGYSGSGGSFRRNGERGMQRPRRLSPEERSQLRRDIRDAGREIYHHRHR
jgi:hypothetical protein